MTSTHPLVAARSKAARADWSTQPVVVCLHSSPGTPAALRWAAAESTLRGSPLWLVVDQADPARPRTTAVSAALAVVRRFGLDIRAFRLPTDQSLSGFTAAHDAVLVIPADETDPVRHGVGSRCCVAAVPSGPAPDGPVLLGVSSSTTQRTVEHAFQEAAARGSAVRAVRVWRAPNTSLGVPNAEAVAAFDVAAERAQQELDAAVDGVAARYPDVEVRKLVVRDDPGAALTALSRRARLLVVTQPASPAASRYPSLLARLPRAAHCPVLVVPAAPD